MLDLISFQSSLDPHGLLRKKIEECVEAMERATGKRLIEMSKQEVMNYQESLSALLANRAQSDLPHNKVAQLLEMIEQPF